MVLQHSPAMFLMCAHSFPLFQKGNRGKFPSHSTSPSAKKQTSPVPSPIEERDSWFFKARQPCSSCALIPSLFSKRGTEENFPRIRPLRLPKNRPHPYPLLLRRGIHGSSRLASHVPHVRSFLPPFPKGGPRRISLTFDLSVCQKTDLTRTLSY